MVLVGTSKVKIWLQQWNRKYFKEKGLKTLATLVHVQIIITDFHRQALLKHICQQNIAGKPLCVTWVPHVPVFINTSAVEEKSGTAVVLYWFSTKQSKLDTDVQIDQCRKIRCFLPASSRLKSQLKCTQLFNYDIKAAKTNFLSCSRVYVEYLPT